MSLVVTVSRALVFSDASLMPQRRLIELVISSYLTGYWRKISLRPYIIRLLFSWYKDQKSSVLWNKTLSEKFSVSNGVRQGGVLSPILFIVYIDELLIRLQSQAVGCHWSYYFAGAFGYADDIVLLAPSASALRLMLNTCCQFATDYNLAFNPGKTQLVRFSLPSSSPSPTTAPVFVFGGQSLLLVDRASHLGHILRSDLSDADNILRVQLTCAAERTAFYLPFRPLILLLRPSCFAPSVYLSMALHCGVWRHLVCILWKLHSIIY